MKDASFLLNENPASVGKNPVFSQTHTRHAQQFRVSAKRATTAEGNNLSEKPVAISGSDARTAKMIRRQKLEAHINSRQLEVSVMEKWCPSRKRPRILDIVLGAHFAFVFTLFILYIFVFFLL
jgi:hypothetical protein